MDLTRRQLLAAGAAGGAAAVAGCAGECGQGLPLVGTAMPHDGEIAVEPTASVPESATLVAFSSLPGRERSLVRAALETGTVRVCMDGDGERAAALRSFAERLPGADAYLADGDDRYALWVRSTDMVFAGTADPPAGDVNPCC